jgi:hypothetical protein
MGEFRRTLGPYRRRDQFDLYYRSNPQAVYLEKKRSCWQDQDYEEKPDNL